MLVELKQKVFEANLELPKYNLVKFTWSNVSAVDRDKELIVIKPSGLDYNTMTYKDMVVVDYKGNVLEGELNPTSDTMTHIVLYKAFPEIGGIVHTHLPWATIWAQAGMNVPALGTTHVDTFYGEVPCARFLTIEEIESAYEENTGRVIVETLQERGIKPLEIPAILLKGHGPFTWGKTPEDAVMNSVVLEEVCRMNYYAKAINPLSKELPQDILDKHYLRKHGKNAYYGQNISII
ncbi:L-ribulose-5-phosphate 4-epimerase [Ruoffia tabacinasalis]|uniref:L-ribulose-5-phosphate 4-epimerase n=1 Tax=Ruoffia tabacinasalis TaxID=87458 RepID=A0A5R9DRK6_9LACT|nr:L-ribulose-5-phosphate 4-epimerase [Ruoffia tabacinasalis]TLQ37958.1 L-ribulose-5-phosphate 4-epimerase [Ruoffia tabacinasalis]